MATAEHPIVDLESWLCSDIGRYLLAWEQARVDALVADAFGFHALQVGMPTLDMLRNNRIAFKAYAGPQSPDLSCLAQWQSVVLSEAELLPFANQSVDLLVLPHGLECAADPHQVLREVERVLVPEGRVVISGFNPWSFWGVRNRTPYMKKWLPYLSKDLVSLPRLKDWLKLLSFDIDRGSFGCYVPAITSKKWIDRFSFMEHAGDRWWPYFGAVYVVSAVKRVHGMRLLTPGWKSKQKSLARGAVVASISSTKELPVKRGQESNN